MNERGNIADAQFDGGQAVGFEAGAAVVAPCGATGTQPLTNSANATTISAAR
ncbi:MAG: hypothetical protein R2867_01595 [Caldilineaceae bacterium]